jgi:glycosyltransferase involved in cell wall biosynthesis
MTKVALDARRLQDEPLTGVGRWIANLLPHLAEEFDITLLIDRRRSSDRLGPYTVVSFPVPPRLPEPFWLQMSAPRWLRSFNGIFHGTYNAIPFAYRGPSVVNIYDLSWEHHAEDFSWPKRASFLTQARWSSHHADVVLTVSEHTRQALVETYTLSPERVLLAPPAVDPIFSPSRIEDLAPILTRLNVEGRYVVALGGARRRALEVALWAWKLLPADGRPQLVVVGAQVPPPHPGIVHAGRLNDTEWSALLAGATAFCYPTRFEGYGMPALEAAASGVPVVCGRVGPLPEVLGDAAEWCDVPSVTAISGALERVLVDEERRAELRRAGLARAAQAPSWTHSAEVVASAYRMALQ